MMQSFQEKKFTSAKPLEQPQPGKPERLFAEDG